MLLNALVSEVAYLKKGKYVYHLSVTDYFLHLITEIYTFDPRNCTKYNNLT